MLFTSNSINPRNLIRMWQQPKTNQPTNMRIGHVLHTKLQPWQIIYSIYYSFITFVCRRRWIAVCFVFSRIAFSHTSLILNGKSFGVLRSDSDVIGFPLSSRSSRFSQHRRIPDKCNTQVDGSARSAGVVEYHERNDYYVCCFFFHNHFIHEYEHVTFFICNCITIIYCSSFLMHLSVLCARIQFFFKNNILLYCDYSVFQWKNK